MIDCQFPGFSALTFFNTGRFAAGEKISSDGKIGAIEASLNTKNNR